MADTWEVLVTHLEADAAATEAQRAERREAVAWFRRVLGRNEAKARLLRYWFRTGVNGLAHAVRLYRCIVALEGVADREKTVRLYLGGGEQELFDAGVMMFDLASGFRRSGREVEFLQPARSGTTESGGRHRPRVADLRVKLLERRIDIECNAKQPSEEERTADQLFWGLAEWHWQLLRASGRVHRLTIQPVETRPSRFSAELGRIKEAALDLMKAGSTGTVSLPGLCQVAYAADISPLPSPLLNGLVYDTFYNLGDSREADRLVHALKKGDQLSASAPGVLVVRGRGLFWHPIHRAGIPSVADRLKEAVSKHPKIGGVIVYETWIDAEESGSTFSCTSDHRSFVTQGLRARAAVYVQNPNARLPLEDEEVELLVGPKMIW
jgi:hypothetical protein